MKKYIRSADTLADDHSSYISYLTKNLTRAGDGIDVTNMLDHVAGLTNKQALLFSKCYAGPWFNSPKNITPADVTTVVDRWFQEFPQSHDYGDMRLGQWGYPDKLMNMLADELESRGYTVQTGWQRGDGYTVTYYRRNETSSDMIHNTEAVSPEGEKLLQDLGVTTFAELQQELGDSIVDYDELHAVLEEVDGNYTSVDARSWALDAADRMLSDHGWPEAEDDSSEMYQDRVKVWQIYYDAVKEYAQDHFDWN